jgi:hypothetical protein
MPYVDSGGYSNEWGKAEKGRLYTTGIYKRLTTVFGVITQRNFDEITSL